MVLMRSLTTELNEETIYFVHRHRHPRSYQERQITYI